MRQVAIGLDIGHSSVKVVVAEPGKPRQRFQFPTVVMPAIHLTDDSTRAKAQADTVEVNGQKFFVGETAIIQSIPRNFSGLHRAWVETADHDALLVAAWNKVILRLGGVPNRAVVTLGLPAAFFDSMRGQLRSRAHTLLRQYIPHSHTVDVRVRSQAEGPLMLVAFKEDGSIDTSQDLDRETWGVVEVGHFTTDFSLSTRGQVRQDVAEHPCSGMHQVYQRVSADIGRLDKQFSRSLESTQNAVFTGKATISGKETDVSHIVNDAKMILAQKVTNDALSLFGETLDTMTGILVAGGGAPVVYPTLQRHFNKVVCPAEPRFSVAEGFARTGLAVLGVQAA